MALRVCILVATMCVAGAVQANASASFGALSNFDIYNDTTVSTHGFEIELEGLASTDVLYWFSGNRYGDPQIVPYATGTYVRWQAPYTAGTWGATTPVAASVIPTGGHDCVIGTPGYDTSGCEHFGVSTNGNPVNTTYRWLVEDPLQPGQLKVFGSNVNLPAPAWSVAPQPAAPPVVQAVILAPPKPADHPEYQFGDAQWVKVFTTERAEPAELDHLVGGNPDVPDSEAEVEIQWVLLQAGAEGADELDLAAPVGEGTEAVVRRYEFYKYIGSYDPESHEALCADPCVPNATNMGNYIGSQMAAINLNADAVVPIPEPAAWLFAFTGISLITMARPRRS